MTQWMQLPIGQYKKRNARQERRKIRRALSECGTGDDRKSLLLIAAVFAACVLLVCSVASRTVFAEEGRTVMVVDCDTELNFRLSPYEDGTMIFTLSAGQRVVVYEVSHGWALCEWEIFAGQSDSFDHLIGWASMEYLREAKP